MTIFTWTVNALYTVPNPKPNYIVQVDYSVKGTDGTYSSTVDSTAFFAMKDEQPNYIPYEQLTEADILSWIKSEPNLVINMEACVQGQIEELINPSVIPQITTLPWVN